MQVDVGAVCEEVLHRVRLVNGEIVENDVDVALLRLLRDYVG